MALKSFTLLIFAVLLCSQVFARDLEEKPDEKNANVNVDDAKYPYGPDQYGPGPYRPPYGPGPYRPPYGPGPYRPPYGPGPYRPPYCPRYCGNRCCSEEEFAVFSQTQMEGFNDDKHGGYGPGYGYGYHRPPYCHYHCGYRCCSAQEYAEFVQAGN